MRHFFAICTVALLSSGQAQLPLYVPTEDLVAWYPFDGNALDISGNEQHGTESNVSFLSESGDAPFQYAHFNGDASINIPHSDMWNAGEYTLTMRYQWQLNPSATPNGNSLIVSKRPPSGWGAGFEHSPSGGLSWSINGNGGVGPQSPQPQGEWVETTWVFGSDSIKIYSGAELVQSAPSPGPMNFNSLPISIGMRGNGWHELIGDIDYLGYWSRTLTAEEVLGIHLMSSQVSGCTDPEACNYMVEAEEEDGSCVYAVYGWDCTGNCVPGTVWYVDAAAAGEEAVGNLSSPFGSVQQAMEVACDGDTILISPGLYVENVNLTKDNIVLSGYAPGLPLDSVASQVRIDCHIQPED